VKPDNTIRNAEIIKRRLAGDFPSQITRDMGLSRNVVAGVLDRAGIVVGDHDQAVLRGADCPHARLTESQVAAIRKRYVPLCRENGAAAIAREFECSTTTILHAIKGETWKHVR